MFQQLTGHMNCIAIDDEKPGLDLICAYISETPFLEMKGAFSSHVDALAFLMENPVDLIISDIELNAGINGMQLYSSLPYRPMIIFVTAHADYAVKSYSLNAVDYLLKPVSQERFFQAVNKAYEQLMHKRNSVPLQPLQSVVPMQTARDYIFVKTENRLQKVLLKDLLYIEAFGDYVRLHINGVEPLLSQQSLTLFESNLSDNFVRVHRSYIVALDKIDEIVRQRIRIGDEMIPISDNYKKDFFNKINL